jgi:hypothetical protein
MYRELIAHGMAPDAARRVAANSRRWWPGRLIEFYGREDDARRLKIVRRREFGQCALSEFADRSIGIFVHRGDSEGEGGSNLFFLANTPLYDKLSRKLADTALVVSDGSLVEPSFLRKFHRPKKEKSGFDAYRFHKKKHYPFDPFDWRCVGYLGQRNGPTLVWQLTRTQS